MRRRPRRGETCWPACFQCDQHRLLAASWVSFGQITTICRPCEARRLWRERRKRHDATRQRLARALADDAEYVRAEVYPAC